MRPTWAEPYVEKLNAKPWGCRYCVIRCHNKCEVKSGPYAYKGKGPEYESFAMMGFNLLIADQEAVAYAGELANPLLDGHHLPGRSPGLGDGIL